MCKTSAIKTVFSYRNAKKDIIILVIWKNASCVELKIVKFAKKPTTIFVWTVKLIII